MNINTFIFDLGGVIIDLNEKASIEALLQQSDISQQEAMQAYQSSDIFKLHEKGLITNDEFRDGLRNTFRIKSNDQTIDQAWNAMLGVIPIKRLELLNQLREKHKVLILSNTNDIHEPCFIQTLKNISGKDSLNHFADEVYYSHVLNMRKPDPEIFSKVLELSGTQAEHALFLDDKKENLLGAESVGINTMHITHPDQIFALEKYV